MKQYQFNRSPESPVPFVPWALLGRKHMCADLRRIVRRRWGPVSKTLGVPLTTREYCALIQGSKSTSWNNLLVLLEEMILWLMDLLFIFGSEPVFNQLHKVEAAARLVRGQSVLEAKLLRRGDPYRWSLKIKGYLLLRKLRKFLKVYADQGGQAYVPASRMHTDLSMHG